MNTEGLGRPRPAGSTRTAPAPERRAEIGASWLGLLERFDQRRVFVVQHPLGAVSKRIAEAGFNPRDIVHYDKHRRWIARFPAPPVRLDRIVAVGQQI